MTMPHETFDAATATLRRGVNLVEASAGTGKTFAIAMLVLRFVTEFGLPLPDILVVTFTKAATEELRERIRARLASARELLAEGQKTEDRSQEPEYRSQESEDERQETDQHGRTANDAAGMTADGNAAQITDDQKTALLSSDSYLLSPDSCLLSPWRQGLAERGIAEDLALQRLELALLDMDLAPVFTIHGFCQRMLQEQALESGQLFDFELITDVSGQRDEVIRDYWRRTVYPLSPLHCALITHDFQTPDDLAKSVEGAARKVARVEPPALTVASALALFDAALGRFTDWWRAHSRVLYPLLEQAVSQGLFKKELSEHFSDWWQQVDTFLGGQSPHLPDALDFLAPHQIKKALNGNKFKTGGGQSGEAKKQAFIASLPLPEEELADLSRARADVTLAVRMGLINALATELSQTLRRRNLLFFDDLIHQLAQGLSSPQGPELRRILGNRYPVALIDEFQDTDDAQYSIFSSLFADSSHYLYLIGDPKQAIYTFRGADIYSYFKARQQADIHLNLARNHRSHPALVEAVNHLFSRREDAFAAAELPYHPVQPAKGAEDGRLLKGDQQLAAMLYYDLDADPDSKDGRWSSTRATARIIAFIVAEISRLLRPDNPIMLTAADQPPRPLTASDIAILVRSHKQGDRFQAALARTGIPAVMASQQSVFATAECDQLLLLMQALAAPGDAALVKTALTSPWFGMDGAGWYALWQDPAQADQWLNRFYDYHQLWREQGFPAMMTRLLEEENVLVTLARQPLAERRIANIHHLLELIQEAAAEEAMGPDKTLQWLHAMQTTAKTAARGPEETELRLESDEEAVTIITMHGAKGLEYPVVFCPFLWQRRNSLNSAGGCVICHDPDKALVMDLGSPDIEARREQALREELAEELRLAYVALTRARCRCYAFWAEVKGHAASRDSRHSALAWLLSLEDGGAFGERVPSLQTADGAVVCNLLTAEHDTPEPMHGHQTATENLAACSFSGHNLHTDWMLHSYSSLTAVTTDRADGKSFDPAQSTEPDAPAANGATAVCPDLPDLPNLPNLPKGAAFGNVVHALLETIPFSTLAGELSANMNLLAAIRQQCAWFGVDVNPGQLAALLQKVVRTPLSATTNPPPFSLADLDQNATIREMPFYLRLQPGSTDQINDILAGSPAVTPVTPKVLQGYLTGFIDLVCCHQGKYYIMDYKSNWLGDQLADYTGQGWPSAARARDAGQGRPSVAGARDGAGATGGRETRPQRLEQAMAEHNYSLQYWLYTLMLHRYLPTVMENYDYATHFGGVMYLFVRGMEPTQPGSGVYYDLPDLATLERLDRCLGRASSIPGARDTWPSMAGGRASSIPGARDTGSSLAGGHASSIPGTHDTEPSLTGGHPDDGRSKP